MHFLQLVWYISAPILHPQNNEKVSSGPLYTTSKTFLVATSTSLSAHAMNNCVLLWQIFPNKIPGAAVEQSMPSVVLKKWSFPGHSSMRSVCERVCMCAYILNYYLYCANYFDLGDSGCEFDIQQLWLNTFPWSTEDHECFVIIFRFQCQIWGLFPGTEHELYIRMDIRCDVHPNICYVIMDIPKVCGSRPINVWWGIGMNWRQAIWHMDSS